MTVRETLYLLLPLSIGVTQSATSIGYICHLEPRTRVWFALFVLQCPLSPNMKFHEGDLGFLKVTPHGQLAVQIKKYGPLETVYR